MALIGMDQRIKDFIKALGVENVDQTGRIIIDLPIGDAVRVYVTYIADERAFDLRFTKGDFEIVTIDKPVEDGGVDVTARVE